MLASSAAVTADSNIATTARARSAGSIGPLGRGASGTPGKGDSGKPGKGESGKPGKSDSRLLAISAAAAALGCIPEALYADNSSIRTGSTDIGISWVVGLLTDKPG